MNQILEALLGDMLNFIIQPLFNQVSLSYATLNLRDSP